MKNNLCLFDRPFKIQRNGVFLFEISFFVLEILTFSIMQIRSAMTSYCLQLKSGTYSINDISGNMEAVSLKVGTKNVHQKRNKMTPLVLLPWQLFRLQSLSVKKVNIPISNLQGEPKGLTSNRHSSILSSLPSLGWVR